MTFSRKCFACGWWHRASVDSGTCVICKRPLTEDTINVLDTFALLTTDKPRVVRIALAFQLGYVQASGRYPSEVGQAEHDRASAARASGYVTRWPQTATRVPRDASVMPYRGGPLRSQLTALRDAPNRSARDYVNPPTRERIDAHLSSILEAASRGAFVSGRFARKLRKLRRERGK